MRYGGRGRRREVMLCPMVIYSNRSDDKPLFVECGVVCLFSPRVHQWVKKCALFCEGPARTEIKTFLHKIYDWRGLAWLLHGKILTKKNTGKQS